MQLKRKAKVFGRLTWVLAIALACLALAAQEAGAVTVSYTVNIASTGNENTLGQTATADYSFTDGLTLVIVLTETTPLDAPGSPDPSGSTALLTAVAFKLPGTVTLVLAGSTVVIAPGSASVDFSGGSFGAGTDVRHEWGATSGGKGELDGSTTLLSDELFDFVSTVGSSGVNQFTGGINRDGPTGLDGPQGGMINEPDGTPDGNGGAGSIDNSLVFTLKLSSALTLAQQTAFLADVQENSAVMYASHAAFGRLGAGAGAVPEPGSLLLLGSGLLALRTLARSRRRS